VRGKAKREIAEICQSGAPGAGKSSRQSRRGQGCRVTPGCWCKAWRCATGARWFELKRAPEPPHRRRVAQGHATAASARAASGRTSGAQKLLQDLAPGLLGRAPHVVVLEALVAVGVLADDLARLGDAGHPSRQPPGASSATAAGGDSSTLSRRCRCRMCAPGARYACAPLTQTKHYRGIKKKHFSTFFCYFDFYVFPHPVHARET
jgi:hypothetical protein